MNLGKLGQRMEMGGAGSVIGETLYEEYKPAKT